MDVEGEPSLDPRRRSPTTVSTSDAASSDAEDGSEANPPQRHQHRGPKAHGSILHPRRSVHVLSPAGVVNRDTASHTRRRLTDVAAPHALEPLYRQQASGTTREPRPSRRRTPDSREEPSGRHQVDKARLSHTRTQKASPCFARGPPSRSRSRSRRHARRYRDSDDCSDSSSRSSRSSSSSSTSHHRRQHHRHRRSRTSSSFEEFSNTPFCSCVTAMYLVRKIRRGKFIKLSKLLPPVLDEAFTTQPGKRSGGSKRRIGDFASWMEAWCIFMAIRGCTHFLSRAYSWLSIKQ